MDDLKIHDFAVIVRNKVDIGRPQKWNYENNQNLLKTMEPILATTNELATAINKVYQAVCSLSKGDMIRFEFPELEVWDQEKLYFKSDEDILKIIKNEHTKIQIFSSFHRAGVLIASYHMRLTDSNGFSVEKTIDSTRVNLRSLVIKIPKAFKRHIDIKQKFLFGENKEDTLRFIEADEKLYIVCSLKDFTSFILRPLLRKLWQNPLNLSEVFLQRCISSTLVHVYKTSPECVSIEEFTQPDQYGNPLRGIATMNKSYNQSFHSSQKNFSETLSTDEEFAVFTFGLSDLILCNKNIESVTKDIQKSKHFKDEYTAVMYNAMHYGILLEWVYLEKFIIDHYNRLLSHAIANEKTTPEEMLSLQKRSMHDLMIYKVGITPYPSREEFLEKARIAHRIPDFQEKLEKKRDLAMDYVLQEYTLRTNKSIQLVNIFVSATAAFGLMEVILSISDQGTVTEKSFWAILTTLLFIGVIIFLSISTKFISSIKK